MKIERNIPIPTQPDRRTWPFKDMQPGESVLLSPDLVSSGTMAARANFRYRNLSIAYKRFPDGSVRVWCVK